MKSISSSEKITSEEPLVSIGRNSFSTRQKATMEIAVLWATYVIPCWTIYLNTVLPTHCRDQVSWARNESELGINENLNTIQAEHLKTHLTFSQRVVTLKSMGLLMRLK